MKIQELAIIFIIIILPISLVLSEYTQFQIQTISLQTEYDAKLTAATYDAIKAFQLNTINSSTSDLANSQMRDLEASINSFRNSLKSGFGLNGYTEEELNNYIPALVYTLYDGFYIYSPYNNIVDEEGMLLEQDEEPESLYGIKPFINYSCRYVKGATDVVITYALDNHVTVQGIVNGKYVNENGYLVDNIDVLSDGRVIYNGVEIKTEHLKENLGGKIYSYAKINGTKYYLIPDYVTDEEGNKKDAIVFILNGTILIQSKEGELDFDEWKGKIESNIYAKLYYKQAAEFTHWFKTTGLDELTYADARDEVINNEEGTIDLVQIWPGDNTPIFDFNNSGNIRDNIENELSNFNQHRLAIIRHKIETNLAIAISNYNSYSRAATNNVFQMPELKEDEWHHITHNIAMISFLQGLHIGGKVYNGYSLVTNSESKEVVLEENIYILGYNNDNDKYVYCRIGDNELNTTVTIDQADYATEKYSAGRINLDFNRAILTNNDSDATNFYYYPLKKYNASYSSIVMQNNVTTYDDIYQYIEELGNVGLKQAFYIALGRERAGKYNSNINENALEEEATNNIPDIEEPPTPQPETYTVTYDLNGGIEGTGPSSQEVEKGTIVTIPVTTPTRHNYNFTGWSESGTTYNVGDSYIVNGNVTFVASWEPILETYIIKYDANGGTGAPTTQTKTHGTNLTLSTTQPTREGYNFLGWATSSSAISKEYDAGGIFVTDAETTLYAVWKINIFYIYNNGTYASTISSSWTGAGITYTNGTSEVELKQSPSGSHRGTAVVIPTKVDLTNFSTLTFNITTYTSSYGWEDYNDCYIGVFSEFNSSTSYTLSASTMLGNSGYTNKKVTIDVSALNGEHYIGAYLKATKKYRTLLKISQIYLD